MTNFSGGGLEIQEGSGKPGKLIKPGIHTAMITNVEYVKSSQKGTDGIKLTLMTKPVDGLQDENGNNIGQKCTDTMWMSPKAWDNDGNPNGANWCTKARLQILSQKLGVEPQYQATQGKNAEEFVNNLKPLFINKKARFAFGGEEGSFNNDEGETIKVVYPFLLTYGFVESLEDVPNDENTKLKYDETNKNHFIRMEVADDSSVDEPNAATTVDGDDIW